jgi:hypothetical protein
VTATTFSVSDELLLSQGTGASSIADGFAGRAFQIVSTEPVPASLAVTTLAAGGLYRGTGGAETFDVSARGTGAGGLLIDSRGGDDTILLARGDGIVALNDSAGLNNNDRIVFSDVAFSDLSISTETLDDSTTGIDGVASDILVGVKDPATGLFQTAAKYLLASSTTVTFTSADGIGFRAATVDGALRLTPISIDENVWQTYNKSGGADGTSAQALYNSASSGLTISAGTASNLSLTGTRSGTDTYALDIAQGSEQIVIDKGVGATARDTVLLNTNANYQSLYFYQSGNNLELKDLRNNNVEEFKNWFAGTQYEAAELVVMTSAQQAQAITAQGIDLLVQHMASIVGTSGASATFSADTRANLAQLNANAFIAIHP